MNFVDLRPRSKQLTLLLPDRITRDGRPWETGKLASIRLYVGRKALEVKK